MTPLGNDKDQVTVMVYMCGSDLESDGGAATADLNEMLYADVGDHVNIIVETAGPRAGATRSSAATRTSGTGSPTPGSNRSRRTSAGGR